MLYTQLGRTGVKVSRLCLGTMNFGGYTTPADSHLIMDKALESGVNFFDTADVYGGRRCEGRTEQIIGEWLAQGGRRRERIVLATKAFHSMGDGPNDRGCSAYHLRAACEASLKRLRTDHIDLYQMHHIDRSTPWEELWQAMEQLTREGKILYAGSSNFAGWNIATANQVAAQRNFLGLICEQSKYSLACRTIELEVLPACRYYGLGVISWGPLDGGVLAGALKGQGVRRAGESARKKVEKLRPQLEAYEALCGELGEEPAAVGLAWLLHQPGLTAPIIGPRAMEQLTGAPLRALEIKFSEETLKKLDAIWPGPGNQAPEAYAW
jgi:aryl-alcohol dehydrogenase-like predicted oxidoreductase